MSERTAMTYCDPMTPWSTPPSNPPPRRAPATAFPSLFPRFCPTHSPPAITFPAPSHAHRNRRRRCLQEFVLSSHSFVWADGSCNLRAPDLIRHGKNHHSARLQDDAAYQNTYPQSQAQQQQSQRTEQQARQRETQQQTQKRTASPKYKEEVEQIVQEEREAKGKLPVYKGLENYKLVEKMGE